MLKISFDPTNAADLAFTKKLVDALLQASNGPVNTQSVQPQPQPMQPQQPMQQMGQPQNGMQPMQPQPMQPMQPMQQQQPMQPMQPQQMQQMQQGAPDVSDAALQSLAQRIVNANIGVDVNRLLQLLQSFQVSHISHIPQERRMEFYNSLVGLGGGQIK